jgi:hypothetical protein
MGWQPNRPQWTIICALAAILVCAWPPDRGSSLLVKGVRWAADPRGALPSFPPPLPIGLGDNGDAVTAHDALEAEYYRHYNSSSWTRRRMALKSFDDPFDPMTERQLLVAAAVFGSLLVWRLGRR